MNRAGPFLLLMSMLIAFGFSQEPRKRVRRAVGSTNTTIKKYPYTVSVNTILDNGNSIVCGGFIASKINVITACHCIKFDKYRKIVVRVGSDFQKKGGKPIVVKVATCHENYSMGPTKNDIAILELANPVTYSSKVKKIELYDRVLGEDESLTQLAIQTGWGYQPPPVDDYASVIQALELPVISKKQCRADFMDIYLQKGIVSVYNDEMCAGKKTKTITKSICIGDSGSPLVIKINGRLRAIGVAISAESNCDRPTYPNVFSEIAYHLPWLKLHVKFD